jgi:hypothetical protein
MCGVGAASAGNIAAHGRLACSGPFPEWPVEQAGYNGSLLVLRLRKA